MQSASLRLSKMERYLHGPTPVTATTYTTGQDFLQASETVTREINQWQPQIQQVGLALSHSYVNTLFIIFFIYLYI